MCKDIAAELNEIYIGYGLLPNRTFGYGHSFGVLSHYYGREAGLELREDIDTVLEPWESATTKTRGVRKCSWYLNSEPTTKLT